MARMDLSTAEQQLRQAGLLIEHEKHPSVANGRPLWLAVRLADHGVPTKLEVYYMEGVLKVSRQSVEKLIRKAKRKT